MQVHAEVKQKADDRQAALAHRLALQYTILQEPALHNVRYSHALKARLSPIPRSFNNLQLEGRSHHESEQRSSPSFAAGVH